MRTIYFRTGLLEKLCNQNYSLCQKALHNFIEGSTRGTKLEKLHAGQSEQPLYSIRVNDTIRIILTSVNYNQTQQWLGIDIFLDHNYKNLNANAYKSFIQTITFDNEELQSDAIIADDDLPILLTSEHIEYHSRQFIMLDDTQQAIKSLSLPLIISGAPGSGKTSTALSLLVNYAKQTLPADDKKKVLYLAQSDNLLRHVQENLANILLLDSDLLEHCEIHFRTPEQLLAYSSSIAQNVLAEKQTCITWLKSYGFKKNKRPAISLTIEQFDDIYQEFRSISGYQTFDDYNNAVGNKHTVFANQNNREDAYRLYTAYQAYLQHSGLIDPMFAPITTAQAYDFVVVDEAQDLSRVQHRSLINHSFVKNHAIAWCIGDHQSIFGSETLVPYLKSLSWQLSSSSHSSNPEISHEILAASYRCPKHIIAFANAVLQLKYHAIGGSMALNKYELLYVKSNINTETPGLVKWLDNNLLPPFLSSQHDDANFAVVTSEHLLSQAQELFGAHRVFTPKQIKGMEYQTILLYRLLDNDSGKAANKAIEERFILDADTTKKPSVNPTGNIKHAILFNQLFVAVTRAKSGLFIYEPEKHEINRISAALHAFSDSLATDETIKLVHSSSEEWQARSQILEDHGLIMHIQALNTHIQRPSSAKAKPVVTHSKTETISSITPTKTQERRTPQKASKPALSNECRNFKQQIEKFKNKKISVLIKEFLKKSTSYYDFIENTAVFKNNLSLFDWLIKYKEKQVTLALIELFEDYLAKQFPEHMLSLLCHSQNIYLNGDFFHVSLLNLLLTNLKEIERPDSALYNYIKVTFFNRFLVTGSKNNHLLNHIKNVAALAARYNDVDLLNSLGIILISSAEHHAVNIRVIPIAAKMAIKFGHLRALKALTTWQINLNSIVDENGDNLAINAITYKQHHMINPLKELGVNLYATNKNKGNLTPAHIAISQYNYEGLTTLLESGVNLNEVTQCLISPITAAIQTNQMQSLKIMHNFGVNLGVAYKDGSTPLLQAIWINKRDIAAYLLEITARDLIAEFSISTINMMNAFNPQLDLLRIHSTAKQVDYYTLHDIAKALRHEQIVLLLNNYESNSSPAINALTFFSQAPSPHQDNSLDKNDTTTGFTL